MARNCAAARQAYCRYATLAFDSMATDLCAVFAGQQNTKAYDVNNLPTAAVTQPHPT